jgi:endonuclease/exonuclease/phosphatase family metal-dependent hydrolase
MNLHCYHDNWELRFHRILSEIIEIDPDIVSFQEVCTDSKTHDSQIRFIQNFFSSHGYPVNTLEFQFTHPAWGQFDEYLVTVSKYGNQGVNKGLLPKSLLQRGYIGVRLENTWYVNTHLEFRADNSNYRNEQLIFLQNRFTGNPHILLGDFNSSPDSSEQAVLQKSQYYPIFPGPTFIGDDGNAADTIDGFWISPEARSIFYGQQGKIILDQRFKEGYLSDHFGVQLNLNRK